jgi:hypothetical protein
VVFSATSTGCTSPVASTAETTSGGYDNDAWHHVVGVIDRPGGSIKLYIDGVLRDTETGVNNTLAAADGNFIIGAWQDTTNNFDGLIDEVKIFDYAMSDKDVSREYSAQNAGIASSLSFANVTPNFSNTVNARFIVQTDAPGYTIAMAQNHDMQNGVNTIPAILSSITTPDLWSEGTTKGLGFALTSGPNIPVKWGTNPNYKYAPVPSSTTSIYSQYRVDVATSLPAGNYENTVTYTATVLP